MLDSKHGTIDAPAVADVVIQFRNEGQLAPLVVIENLDGSASAAVKMQESDGSGWSDIAGTPATIDPGESFEWMLSTATMRDIGIHAGGNLKLLVHVIRQADGELSDWGNIR